jgi:hypothetical protein
MADEEEKSFLAYFLDSKPKTGLMRGNKKGGHKWPPFSMVRKLD